MTDGNGATCSPWHGRQSAAPSGSRLAGEGVKQDDLSRCCHGGAPRGSQGSQGSQGTIAILG